MRRWNYASSFRRNIRFASDESSRQSPGRWTFLSRPTLSTTDAARVAREAGDSRLSSKGLSINATMTEVRESLLDDNQEMCLLCRLKPLSWKSHWLDRTHVSRERIVRDLLAPHRGGDARTISRRYWHRIDASPQFSRAPRLAFPRLTLPGEVASSGKPLSWYRNAIYQFQQECKFEGSDPTLDQRLMETERLLRRSSSPLNTDIFQKYSFEEMIGIRRASLRELIECLRRMEIVKEAFVVQDPDRIRSTPRSVQRLVPEAALCRSEDFEKLELLGDSILRTGSSDRLSNMFCNDKHRASHFLTRSIENNESLGLFYEFMGFDDMTGVSNLVTKFKADVVEALLGELQIFLWSQSCLWRSSVGTSFSEFPKSGGSSSALTTVVRHVKEELMHLLVMRDVESIRMAIDEAFARKKWRYVRTACPHELSDTRNDKELEKLLLDDSMDVRKDPMGVQKRPITQVSGLRRLTPEARETWADEGEDDDGKQRGGFFGAVSSTGALLVFTRPDLNPYGGATATDPLIRKERFGQSATGLSATALPDPFRVAFACRHSAPSLGKALWNGGIPTALTYQPLLHSRSVRSVSIPSYSPHSVGTPLAQESSQTRAQQPFLSSAEIVLQTQRRTAKSHFAQRLAASLLEKEDWSRFVKASFSPFLAGATPGFLAARGRPYVRPLDWMWPALTEVPRLAVEIFDWKPPQVVGALTPMICDVAAVVADPDGESGSMLSSAACPYERPPQPRAVIDRWKHFLAENYIPSLDQLFEDGKPYSLELHSRRRTALYDAMEEHRCLRLRRVTLIKFPHSNPVKAALRLHSNPSRLVSTPGGVVTLPIP